MRIFTTVLNLATAVLAFALIGTPAVQAQVIAEGKQPLTLEMADKATAYMEWMLDAPFSVGDRQRYRDGLVDTWRSRNQGAIDGVLATISAHEKLSALEAGQRSMVRDKVQGEFLAMLRSNPKDDAARWLLGIYDASHGAPKAPATVTPVSSALTGRWTAGRISMIQYRDSYTGAPAPTSGNSFAYEFKADGTYAFIGLMQSTMYNCTTAVFSNETGTYTVEGDTVSLRPEKNPYRMTNSCAPSSNKEAPGKLIAKSYRFRIVPENNKVKLDLISADGSTSTFRREQ